jgi:pimeloyl-ACP methyl ester carboxylesterase
MECKLGNISLHYSVMGDGRPIFMLHGGYCDHNHMKTCMEPLFENRSNWKRIYIDYPGHGKTKDHESIRNLEDVLNVILKFIDEVIPNQSFVVAGMSRGGYLSRGLLYHRAEFIDGVLLVAPSTVAAGEETSLPPHNILSRSLKFESDLKEGEEWMFDSMVATHTEWVLKRIRDDYFPAFELADENHHKKIMANFKFSFDIDANPATFDKPVLIVVGRQDSMVGYRDAWNVLHQFPRSTFAVLDKAGHNLQVEQDQVFSALTTEWLDRIEEYGGDNYVRGIEYKKSLLAKPKE